MMYWADEKEVTFGSFSIKPGTLEIVNDYEIRTFEISKVSCGFTSSMSFKLAMMHSQIV